MRCENIIKLLILFIVLSSSLNLVFSHEGEDDSINQNVGSPISPFFYFAQGDYVTGFFVIVFWIAIVKGLFELIIIILSKVIIIKEKK